MITAAAIKAVVVETAMITDALITVPIFWSQSCYDYSSCGDFRVALITASVITAKGSGSCGFNCL